MSDGPWDLIGWGLIGGAIGRGIRRHWRLIVAAFIAFLLYKHFFM